MSSRQASPSAVWIARPGRPSGKLSNSLQVYTLSSPEGSLTLPPNVQPSPNAKAVSVSWCSDTNGLEVRVAADPNAGEHTEQAVGHRRAGDADLDVSGWGVRRDDLVRVRARVPLHAGEVSAGALALASATFAPSHVELLPTNGA